MACMDGHWSWGPCGWKVQTFIRDLSSSSSGIVADFTGLAGVEFVSL